MAVKYVVTFTGSSDVQPLASDSKNQSLLNLSHLCKALASGTEYGEWSLGVRNDAVPAAGTVTFAGGATANDTVTINGTALTATQKNATNTITFSVAAPSVDETITVNGSVFTVKTGCARGTAAFSTIVADNVVTVNGQAFTAKASAVGDAQFNLGASDAAAATNCAAKISAHPTVGLLVEAIAVSDTVHIKALASGTAGNAITLTKTGSPITVSGATLASGAALTSAQFDTGDDITQAARQFTAAVNASTDVLVSGVITATSSAGVSTLRALTAGTGGNSLTLAETGTNIARGAATFTNGAAASNNAWDPGNTAAIAAASLAAAITASSTSIVSGHVSAEVAAGVVTLTALVPGVSGNAISLAKSGSNITVSGSGRLTGGTETEFTIDF